MIRTVAAVAAFSLLALAAPAAAQTWGQPVYLNAYGRPVGGTPLSEVETRAYVETGRWADGYSDRPRVYVQGSAYGGGGYAYGDGRYGHGHGYGYGYDSGRYRHGYGYSHGYGRDYSRYDPAPRPGYRDEWGYNDDRPPSARRWSQDRRHRHYDRDRDCGCGDVYLYDR